MIGKLTGIIDKITDDYIIIDVAGVGYIIHASKASISAVGKEGVSVSILVETHVREDQITLFGFATEEEKLWFTTLTKVNGVGPKMALKILSTLSVNDLQVAIAAKDKSAFKPVSGVGPKLAERIITELKDKSVDISLAHNVVPLDSTNNSKQGVNQTLVDATAALENLGFNKSEAFSVVNRGLSKDADATIEDLIKKGLKELSGN